MPAALDISIDCLAILPESAAAETSEDVSHFQAEEVNPLIYDSRIDFPILEAGNACTDNELRSSEIKAFVSEVFQLSDFIKSSFTIITPFFHTRTCQRPV